MEIYRQKTLELIESTLQELTTFQESPFDRLHQAARYSLFSSGKRLRPLLVMATQQACGGQEEMAIRSACALEMVHTYSLIHDDLPCMDNDDYRRGKPTLHKEYDEATAVLAGDFLLTYAFEVIATDSKLSDTKKSRLIALLAKSSGNNGMIGGQMLDLISENTQVNIQTLKQIHCMKTGALLNCSILFGAIISDVPDEILFKLEHFGQCMGLAFQIVDDVLDVTASLEKKCRVISSDTANQKSTYVSLLGLDGSKQAAQSLYKDALVTLDDIPISTQILKELASYIIERSI
ncbi:MAG: polyprenyl synthetase family protein [Parachlamydiales bacterium]|nr:polyprenyl synthetase family protein [Parachlamydiales bacterium]